MSGAAGGTRIPRSAVEQTVKDYTDNILSRIEGFKDAKLSGSFNRPEKEDFGDIDIIVTIETDRTKKEVKKAIADLFQSLPDKELPPLQNPRYKGKKFINHGEMVSNLYPISGMPGEFVQVDNIISLSQEEGEFKKTILDYPAELQGLILGLVKTPLLEEDPKVVFSRLGIKDIPKAGKDQEYEFHIDTSDLTLRLVTYGENYRILNSNTVWQSKDYNDVQTLLKDYDLKGSFEDIIAKVKTLKNERSKNRVKGFFKKSIKVGAAEKDTPKGDTKQRALDTVAQLEESYRSKARNGLRAQYLEEEEKTRTAIFPGAFKPPHKDHINRIIAASEKVGNEGKVIVLVSPSTRAKDGQETISAKQSLRVFNILKDKDIIPSNVNIIISPEKSPVLAAYKEFEANKDQPYIAVFGKDDKARFKNIDEKLPNVEVNSFESAGIGNTSATDLRIALLNKDKSEVEKYIPAGITADEYIDALGLAEEVREEVIVEDTDAAADLWEPHAAMLDRMKNQPDLLKGLWKGLSKPSRRALVLYYRRKKQQTENVIPQDQEKAAPYGSGYTLVDEGLWANINAKKKAGKKTSHKNSNAYKDAKKAGDALEKTKGLEENRGEKKLRVFDFDDTLVHVDATIHITHKDGTKSGLTPAEYAVYVPKEGDTFNFSEFSSVIKKAKPLKDNIQDLIKSHNDPTEKTTILTARLLGYPVKKYLKDEFNIEPYVVGLGSSDPKDKSRWIEAQIKKGYNNIEFRDDSQKNVDAVAGLKDKYPEISIKSMLVENASYNKDNKVQYKIAKLTDHMKAKGMRIEPLPTVKFINGDSENARDFFGKTAYYDPASSTIVLYTEGRHPKDIVRSFAHEMIHHMQNLEGRLENITTTNTHEDDNLNDLEKEANLKGTMTFRNWTDSLNEVKEEVTDSMVVVLSRKGNQINLYNLRTNEALGNINTYGNEVTGVAAKKGYGPLMYELGMANIYPKGLQSDRHGNTEPAAEAVWKKYIAGASPNIKVEKLTPKDRDYRTTYAGDGYDSSFIPDFYNYKFYNPNTAILKQLIERGNALSDELKKQILLDSAKLYNDMVNEANLKGTMTFRNWTDSLNENTGDSNPLKLPYIDTWHEGQYKVEAGKIEAGIKLMTQAANEAEKLAKEEQDGGIAGEAGYYRGTIAWLKKDYDTVKKYIKDKFVKSTGNDEVLNRLLKNKDTPYKEAYSINEAIIGDKIECDNCGWSWEMEDGGKDPYICHKCGHDNTPLQEKKNKDPFGLNQYARELATGLEEVLVSEGMYDTMTNQISSEIFKAWKEQFNKESSIKKASFEKSYNLLNKKGRSIVFDLKADLNFIETEESIYSPDGDADAGESETYDDEGNVEDTGIDATISLYFQVDPRTLPKLWSTISMDLKDIVRHEIEHLTQSGYNVIASKELPDDQTLRYYIQNLKILPYSNYYLLDKEIPAMLQGMYFKAKKMKKPFKDILNGYLDIFVNNETISKEDKSDILHRWRVAARELNLPSF
jgi:nicotinic acid mononucleotide adenylyltransferase/predicted nucleotidyltransferase